MGKVLRTCAPLAIALVLAAAVAGAGEAKTPLGKWMKPNMGGALSGQDFGQLKTSFDLVASKPPSGSYPQWAAMSQKGSDAAAKQDLAGVKAACKSCHDAYKAQYIKEFPDKPFP